MRGDVQTRRRACCEHRMQLPGQHTEGRVLAQFVMIVEVLVARYQAKDSLPH